MTTEDRRQSIISQQSRHSAHGDDTIDSTSTSTSATPLPPAAAAEQEKVKEQDVDVERGSTTTDILMGEKRSTAENIVICIANLIPPLGVALSTRDSRKVLIAFLLTLCLYLPGLLYAFSCMSTRSRKRWIDSPCTLGL